MDKTKTVSYTAQNTYATLNRLTSKTKNVWMVFHGMGYLSKYFIRYFSELDPETNYIIAPQAPSKYYQDMTFQHVGACWLTRENTEMEIENVLNYVDEVFKQKIQSTVPNLIVMGYSQGVSIAARWVARRKVHCDKLILHSGGIPKELKPEDFDFLSPSVPVIYLYGDQDKYVNEARKTEESLLGNRLFGQRLQVEVFPGIHEVHVPSLIRYSKGKDI